MVSSRLRLQARHQRPSAPATTHPNLMHSPLHTHIDSKQQSPVPALSLRALKLTAGFPTPASPPPRSPQPDLCTAPSNRASESFVSSLSSPGIHSFDWLLQVAYITLVQGHWPHPAHQAVIVSLTPSRASLLRFAHRGSS